MGIDFSVQLLRKLLIFFFFYKDELKMRSLGTLLLQATAAIAKKKGQGLLEVQSHCLDSLRGLPKVLNNYSWWPWIELQAAGTEQ